MVAWRDSHGQIQQLFRSGTIFGVDCSDLHNSFACTCGVELDPIDYIQYIEQGEFSIYSRVW